MILITGGTGFLGQELIKRLYGTDPIRVVARNEGKLIELKQKYPEIEIITGDISDEFICQKALIDVDGVFHLAAFKHVGLAEEQSYQCITTNVNGTINLLNNFKGDTFLAISTDKAAQPRGVYGCSKLLMEKLIEERSKVDLYTDYLVVRYGNVLYSTGSVLCKWKELIQQGKQVTVTDLDATRFFWTIEQAVDLIFECLRKATDAKPYVPKMKAMNIKSLLLAMFIKYGAGIPQKELNIIGLQPGENMHETMDGVTFSNQVEQYTIDEILPLI